LVLRGLKLCTSLSLPSMADDIRKRHRSKKPKTNTNLFAGIVLVLVGVQRLSANNPLLGWACIVVGTVVVAQFFWLRRKRPDTR